MTSIEYTGTIRKMGRSYYVVIPAPSMRLLAPVGSDPVGKDVIVKVKL